MASTCVRQGSRWMAYSHREAPIDRRTGPAGTPVSMARSELAGASVRGWAASVRDVLSARAGRGIRFATPAEKYRLPALGGNLLEDALCAPSQRAGFEALVDFLLSARPSEK